MGKMKAVRFHGKEDLRVEDVDEPEIEPGKVKIKPAWCGICGTDIHEYQGGPNLCPEKAPHPITGEKVPLTFGHEFSGRVEEVGDGVSNFKAGDRVVVRPIIYDSECGSCLDGLINCCDKNGFVGLSGWGGGLSDYIVVPEYAVFKVPDNVSLDIAALTEPLAVGWHSVKMSPYKDGDSVLILGGGPIGLAVLQALRARGCKQIIVSEISSKRKQFAKDFGAHVIIDPSKEDIVARCRELCDNKGVDVCFDAAGVQPAMEDAVRAVRARGTFVNIAIWEKQARINTNDFNFRERRYVGVATFVQGDFEEVLAALSDGRLDMSPKMITKRIELDQVLEEGFKTLINDRDNHVKILVKSSGEK